MGSAVLPFGDGLRADLYYPLAPDGRPKPGKLPVVVWLHSHSYATGYSRYAGPPFESLTRRGFAVLAFDQLGFGTRVLDARNFYEQYPKWSLMGKMVADTRAAIDAVSALDVIDTDRIYIIGYGLGAKVGLIAAALDTRVKAIAAVCGFDPLRLDTADKGVEGIRHYSHLHGLMPRLGFFAGQESRLPFDYDEVVALIAPRPALLIAPTLDRYAPVERRAARSGRLAKNLPALRPPGRAGTRDARSISIASPASARSRSSTGCRRRGDSPKPNPSAYTERMLGPKTELTLRSLHLAGDAGGHRTPARVHPAHRLGGGPRPAPAARRRQLPDRLDLRRGGPAHSRTRCCCCRRFRTASRIIT